MTPKKQRRPRGAPQVRETAIVVACLWRLRTLPRSDFWRVNSVARPRADGSGGMVRAGPKGAADISGVIGPEGWRCEIEVKRPGGSLTEWQIAWRDTMRAHGAIWFLATDPEELYRALMRELAERRASR